jgi:hypothetical protein
VGQRYAFETFAVAPALDTHLQLYAADGTTQIDDSYSDGSGNSDARILWQAPQTGTFYLRVTPASSIQSGSYWIRILPKYDEGATWDAGWEPDNDWVTASPIILNQTQLRSLYERGHYRTNRADRDHFWFYAQAGHQYTLNLLSVAATLRANLYLLSLDGSTILASNTSFLAPGSPKSLSYTFATPGLYYVRVAPSSDSSDDYGDYALRVTSVVPALQPSLESITLLASPGAGNTDPQSVTLANSGPGSFSWSISADQPWLHVSPNNGTVPPSATLSVWADRTGLPLGTYTGHLTLTATGVDNSPYVIPVTLHITDRQDVLLPFIRR